MAIKKLKKDQYEVRCRYQGRAVRRRFTDKWDARDFEELVVNKGLSPDHAAAKVKGFVVEERTERAAPTFREFVENVWLPDLASGDASRDEEPVTVGTLECNRMRIRTAYAVLGDKPITKVSREDWQDLKRSLRTDPLKNGQVYKPATANITLRRVRQAMRYAEAKGYIDRNPFEYMRLIKIPKTQKPFWRLEECAKFLETARAKREDHYLYFLLALNTAMRRSELLGLRKMDFDFTDRVIHVRQQWDAAAYDYQPEKALSFKRILKNGAVSKSVPMTDAVYEAFYPVVNCMIGDETRIFYFSLNFMKNPSYVFRRYARQAGIPEIKAHSTRDCVIGNLKRAGVSDRLIAQVAGCSIKNLDDYGHLNLQDVKYLAGQMTVKEAD